MKPEIHPTYPPARIQCACGNTIETSSTRGSFNVEICANCHPFYTGKYKLMDTAGRVERFRKKYEAKAAGETSSASPAAAAENAEKASKASKAKAKAKA